MLKTSLIVSLLTFLLVGCQESQPSKATSGSSLVGGTPQEAPSAYFPIPYINL